MKTINCVLCGLCGADLDSVFYRYITGYILVVLQLNIYGLAHICAQMFVDVDGCPTTIRWTVVKCFAHSHVPPAGRTVTTLVKIRSLFKFVFLANLQIL